MLLSDTIQAILGLVLGAKVAQTQPGQATAEKGPIPKSQEAKNKKDS